MQFNSQFLWIRSLGRAQPGAHGVKVADKLSSLAAKSQKGSAGRRLLPSSLEWLSLDSVPHWLLVRGRLTSMSLHGAVDSHISPNDRLRDKGEHGQDESHSLLTTKSCK